ncbi:uncharacterized protein CcaverHIS019_0100710 [Cutaneotrichosporon cavernicola]|uniref:Transcription initiation factor TFIID subunit 13 n=1 Tax=Cutaneotrichosporon cavernicola TaxID=279322 RepID=A0AA48L1R3_9TREE|nr:uncharacterized protein CcaverHIS019_0100710 [Cutaneotrichosporon cavernicola]BEI87353.1 hypothetical protein CcaverHIS019_0100710 [Cutaneotrichosporon cavernicola]
MSDKPNIPKTLSELPSLNFSLLYLGSRPHGSRQRKVLAPTAPDNMSQPPSQPPSAPTSGPPSGPATPLAATPSASSPVAPANAPAVPPNLLATLSLFFAHQNYNRAMSLRPAVPPVRPSTQDAIAQFQALPPDRQRHVHSTFIASQRMAQQNAHGKPPQPIHPSLGRPGIAPQAVRPKDPSRPVKRLRIDVPDQRPSASTNPLTALISSATERPLTAGNSRPREEPSMRGQMRGEIARLMYACGDVAEPDVDSVDVLEDMTAEFLADLCRPFGATRSNPSVPRQPIPLKAEALRHRLSSHSYLKKYLDRWDDMMYMSQELQQSKRVAQPSNEDLIKAVGKSFLGLDDDQQQQGKKRDDGEKKRGRPPKPPEERKKPGPKKGWKKNLDPNAPPKKRAAPAKKKARAGTGSAAPSPSKIQ